MILYAKSDPIQSIQQHTDDLIFVMEKLRKSLEGVEIDWDLLKIIIVAHDLGKINGLFQQRIKERIKTGQFIPASVEEIDHNILSAAFLAEILGKLKISESSKNILYKSVLFHHHYFLYYLEHIDRFSRNKIQKAVYEYVEKIYKPKDKNIIELNNYIKEKLEISQDVNLLNIDYAYLRHFNEGFNNNKDKREYLLLKGMLHLCDHIASSGFKDDSEFYFENQEIKNIDHNIICFLQKEIENRTNKTFDIDNIKFKDFQEITRGNVDNDILTIAFTGSGKTISDHRWSGIRKFYLVPTRISSEAFYFDSVEIYGEDKVGILHGDISLYIDNQEEDSLSITQGTYILTRNLSKPYIISTIDQIVTAIFKYPNYEKTLAALLNSKITVDEIHLLTPRMFLMLLYLISFLKNNKFDVKFHFMSATVPEIYIEEMQKIIGRDYVLNEIEVDKNNPSPIEIKTKKFNSRINKEEKTDSINKWIKDSEKTLIILNTIAHALDLYKDLSEINGNQNVHLLHSRFKFEDKKLKYRDILKKESRGIWITTQLVEVALNIDFPVVISELSPFESIIQRMGRCNRSGELSKGYFYVFEDKSYEKSNHKIYDENLLKQTAIHVNKISKEQPLLSQENRKRFLEAYFESKKVKQQYLEDFDTAKKEIFRLYDIKLKDTDEPVTGDDLFFEIDPHLNITDNKIQAQRLFREGELQQRIILKSDYDKISSGEADNRYKEIAKKSIPISKGIYWKLKTNYNYLMKQHRNLLIIDDENNIISYTREKGLEILEKK